MSSPFEFPQRPDDDPHGICETLWRESNSAVAARLHQRADRSGTAAIARRQGPHAISRDPSQGRNRQPGPPCQQSPAHNAQCRRAGMAVGRKSRGQKRQIRTNAGGAQKLRQVVRGTCCNAATIPRHRPPTAPQMHPGPQRGRQPPIPRHHKGKPPAAADSGQVPAQPRPVRRAVMAQHHPAQPPRQPRHGRTRIGQPRRVGEQPQHG